MNFILDDIDISHKKQNIWRQKQIEIFYGSGRPVFRITKDNCFERKNYDGNYYMIANKWKELDNKNFIPERKNIISDYTCLFKK
jgi:hypothetical protein